jgi:hypothetical protein
MLRYGDHIVTRDSPGHWFQLLGRLLEDVKSGKPVCPRFFMELHGQNRIPAIGSNGSVDNTTLMLWPEASRALRRALRPAGVRVITATVVREPTSQISSQIFYMGLPWALRGGPAAMPWAWDITFPFPTRADLVHFAHRYLEDEERMLIHAERQTHNLLNGWDSPFMHHLGRDPGLQRYRSPRFAEDHRLHLLERAETKALVEELMSEFDVVGVTEKLSEFHRCLFGTLLGVEPRDLMLISSNVLDPAVAGDSAKPSEILVEELHKATGDARSDALLQLVRNLTEADQYMYELARRRWEQTAHEYASQLLPPLPSNITTLSPLSLALRRCWHEHYENLTLEQCRAGSEEHNINNGGSGRMESLTAVEFGYLPVTHLNGPLCLHKNPPLEGRVCIA